MLEFVRRVVGIVVRAYLPYQSLIFQKVRAPISHLTLSLQALLPVPLAPSSLLGKVLAIVSSCFIVAAFVLSARPYEPSQSWKGPVQAAVLLFAATCASVVALAGAVDLNFVGEEWALQALSASAYAIVVLLAATLVLLIVSVGRVVLGGLRAEQTAIVEARTQAAALQRNIADPIDTHSAVGAPLSIMFDGIDDAARLRAHGQGIPTTAERSHALQAMGSFRSVHAQPQASSRGRLRRSSSRGATKGSSTSSALSAATV